MTGNYLTKPQQHPAEISDFVAFLKQKQIASYLEIGSKFGGALWLVTRIMPKGARVVAVDLPNSHWGRSESQPSLEACFKHLRRDGFDAHLFIGDSTDAGMVQRVVALSPFDAIFIDANHTEPYVRKDFANYGKLSRIVCFHDIGWNPANPAKMPIEVPKVWAELKTTYREQAAFTEIKHDHGHNGIGIMEWR